MGVCLKGIRLEGTLKSCSSYGEFELWEFELWRFNCIFISKVFANRGNLDAFWKSFFSIPVPFPRTIEATNLTFFPHKKMINMKKIKFLSDEFLSFWLVCPLFPREIFFVIRYEKYEYKNLWFYKPSHKDSISGVLGKILKK